LGIVIHSPFILQARTNGQQSKKMVTGLSSPPLFVKKKVENAATTEEEEEAVVVAAGEKCGFEEGLEEGAEQPPLSNEKLQQLREVVTSCCEQSALANFCVVHRRVRLLHRDQLQPAMSVSVVCSFGQHFLF
jgi:hypothetical protein